MRIRATFSVGVHQVTASRFHTFARTIIDRSYETLMSHPSIALLEVYLILAHYHATVKLGDSGEQIWALSHKMIELAMTLGLHRDPGDRGLPEHEVAKRRWVWWNILSFERYVPTFHFLQFDEFFLTEFTRSTHRPRMIILF